MARCCWSFVVVASICFAVNVSARAVNISNTWMLPEEGFPVFYRYFRDRISWYEADAVCQFHHANLVTADSTSQYDAIRAYLKELDITDNIWIGLSKTSEKPNFTWTDFQPLTNEGHWLEASPSGNDPLCVVMDPAADFLWKPLACGGPEVAAFICELPIPSWAQGPKGCLLTELPSLTVLYIPEQSALELTSDCGLDGTKRIACKGNADREDMLKQLTCTISTEEFDDKYTKASIISSSEYETSTNDNSISDKTTKSWTSNTVDTDYGMPTRHRRETEDTLSPISTASSFKQTYSTTDLSWNSSQKQQTTKDGLAPSSSSSILNFEVTTARDSGSDTTLDVSVTEKSSIGLHPFSTLSSIANTDETASEQAETASVGVGESVKTDVATPAAAEEYPNAINQGQLFSIIENGTMFDIIELNDTMQERSTKNSITNEQQKINNPSTETISTSTQIPSKPLKHTKKPLLKTQIKKYSKESTSKDNRNNKKITLTTEITPPQTTENLNKEFEMIPVIKDISNGRLNRTFRKELPSIYDENDPLENNSHSGVPKVINFSISNSLNGPIEENFDTNFPEQKNRNMSDTVFDATIKRDSDDEQIESLDEQINRGIDPELKNLNHESLPKNNESESVVRTIEKYMSKEIHDEVNATLRDKELKTVEITTDKVLNTKTKEEDKQNNASVEVSTETNTTENKSELPNSPEDSSESSHVDPEVTTDNFHEETSEGLPKKPNRKRQLTRTQRKTFYPYFFSRMLG